MYRDYQLNTEAIEFFFLVAECFVCLWRFVVKQIGDIEGNYADMSSKNNVIKIKIYFLF